MTKLSAAPVADNSIWHAVLAADERRNENACFDDCADHAAPRRSCRSARNWS